MRDILAHLRACADVWGMGIQAMLTQQHPTLRYVSPRTYIKKTDYPVEEFRPSLQAYTRQRTALLQILHALSREDWSRGATFTRTTRGREHTVFDYALYLVKVCHNRYEGEPISKNARPIS